MPGMKKGIVFSIDAVFAFYIMLLLMTAFVGVLQVQTQSNDDMLAISRLARDVYEVKSFSPGVSLPAGISEGAACADAEIAGSALAIVYDAVADEVKVEPRVVCISG